MPSNKRHRAVIAVGVLVAVQLAAVGIYWTVSKRRSASPAEFRVERLSGNVPAPDIQLEREGGARVSVHATGGKVRLVHFWATWCPPCVKELPGLLETSRALADSGLSLVAVSMDDDWETIRIFFDGDVPPEVYRAVDGNAHKLYDVYSLPDTYLVPNDGRLKLRYGGARDWQSEAARKHLRSTVESARSRAR